VSVALISCATVLAAGFGLLGARKAAGAEAMQQRASHVGFSGGAYRAIGGLELAGAAGLLVGLAQPPLGMAAAAGLLTLMVGAVVVHRRNGDPVKAAVPALVFGGGTAAYLALLLVAT
jgi:hypothetical protein